MISSGYSSKMHTTTERLPSFEHHATSNFGSYQGLTSQLATSTDQPILTAVHRQATVRVSAPGYDAMNVSASVMGPYMSNVPCSVSGRPGGELAINFVPKDIGEHVIEVKSGDIKIGGSPIRYI
jgi:hypothetical protein